MVTSRPRSRGAQAGQLPRAANFGGGKIGRQERQKLPLPRAAEELDRALVTRRQF